jgi:hypothetical protein
MISAAREGVAYFNSLIAERGDGAQSLDAAVLEAIPPNRVST